MFKKSKCATKKSCSSCSCSSCPKDASCGCEKNSCSIADNKCSSCKSCSMKK